MSLSHNETMTMLRSRLEYYIQADFVPPPEKLESLMKDMLIHIGDPDPVLRDEQIYRLFSTWIPSGVLPIAQLRHLLEVVLSDEYIGYRLGEQGTDSVFRRSFSMLLIPLILSVDHQTSFLSQTEWNRIFEKVVFILKNERDLRGYVAEADKGWAHATAHTADALEDLARSKYAQNEERIRILEAIRIRLLTADMVFTHDEDDRLAAAAETTLICGTLPQADLQHWIDRLGEAPITKQPPFAGEARVNARLFIQRLCERLAPNPAHAHTVEALRQRAISLRM
ncbi:DUF2785 domain-containing protein [Saccharibacillus sp. JS10]|uniref:DUF2785 domain-containing protein n=1 Tax=Saccharibacillus sp. JS10 TaxID=2950552 RepID=UPI00210E7DC0|nr:DUF2785 domain-containing protein [Saccharibacillus sp. JS10]MCQ4087077.1 DUF2785 domain-containing protein [Saccharibacillus sp. JS10]